MSAYLLLKDTKMRSNLFLGRRMENISQLVREIKTYGSGKLMIALNTSVCLSSQDTLKMSKWSSGMEPSICCSLVATTTLSEHGTMMSHLMTGFEAMLFLAMSQQSGALTLTRLKSI